MRHRKRTNGTLFDCIYIRNCHNYVSECGMRVPGHINYWKYCPFCGHPITGGKDLSNANWLHDCVYTFEDNKYHAACEPEQDIYDYKNWCYCPFCARRIIDLSREGDRSDTRD